MVKSAARNNIRLGLFVIIGTILLVVASYLIGNNKSMFSKTFSISAKFNNVNGLILGNNVRFSGIVVGTVKDIEMESDTLIRVRMAIEEKMQQYIKKDAIATIGSDGLVGSMIINIIPGKNNAPLVQDNDEISSYSRIATEDMLSTLNVTNENAAMLTADLLKVSQSLTKGKGTMGRLLNDTIMASNLEKIVINLKLTSEQANVAFAKLNKMVNTIDLKESTAGILLSDTISGKQMRQVIANLQSTSLKMEEITKEVQVLVKSVKEGEGALDYLTKDTLLVQKLDATLNNIESGTEKFDKNMEALKHNFLFRGYFKKLEKKQLKEEKRRSAKN
ncbi:ABC transporter permease [Sediminicola sp. YIK13]|uniref:MlaD family protein n=1 Tax=Sediminicola sp. YIK13 TaxID=1453352 RepID=UPI000720F7F8|nr:MlaD family protein [Sediminicola sp. YIK13]ALM06886.1 ABC transporter permease [Sediminicola sp. YIK13]